MRIAQRIGLHRDGKELGWSVFEAEMRRRVWWQIILLDNRNAQMSGLKNSLVFGAFNTKVPANLNDADLDPNMTEMPLEHKHQTEMIFVLITCEIGQFVKEAGYQKLFSAPSSRKDKLIEELDLRLHNKYLRYCDRSIPLHCLCMVVAKSITNNIKMTTHHPRNWKDKTEPRPQEERDLVYNLSLNMIETDATVHVLPSLQRFVWHVDVYFQVDVFVVLLSELCHRPAMESTERAWRLINTVYHTHPELLGDDLTLYAAIGNLTLRAWAIREARMMRAQHGHMDTPGFIADLRAKRVRSANNASSDASYASSGSGHSHSQVHSPTGNLAEGSVDPSSLDLGQEENWDYWTIMFNELESGWMLAG